ncbi:MAG: AIR synthase-related protein, partial [Smithella sp.]
PRIIPQSCRCIISRNSWEIPPVFQVMKEIGKVDEKEMFRVFNMGIGMMIVVPEKESEEVAHRLEVLGEKAYIIGAVEKREKEQALVCFSAT